MKLSNDEKKELESIFSELKNGIDKTKAIKGVYKGWENK